MTEIRKKPTYLELALSFFKINMVTFGGGYAIMPIIKKVYVNDKGYLAEEDMFNLIALAQSIPGAMAINTSMLVGYKLRGVKGAIVSLIGAFLPPLLVISVVYLFYAFFQTDPTIQFVLSGMRGAVSAVMFYSAFEMVRSLFKNNVVFSLTLLLGAFMLGWFTEISVGYIMLGAGFIGFIFFTFIYGRLD